MYVARANSNCRALPKTRRDDVFERMSSDPIGEGRRGHADNLAGGALSCEQPADSTGRPEYLSSG